MVWVVVANCDIEKLACVLDEAIVVDEAVVVVAVLVAVVVADSSFRLSHNGREIYASLASYEVVSRVGATTIIGVFVAWSSLYCME